MGAFLLGGFQQLQGLWLILFYNISTFSFPTGNRQCWNYFLWTIQRLFSYRLEKKQSGFAQKMFWRNVLSSSQLQLWFIGLLPVFLLPLVLNPAYLTLFAKNSSSSLSPYGTKIKNQITGKVMPTKEPLYKSNTASFFPPLGNNVSKKYWHLTIAKFLGDFVSVTNLPLTKARAHTRQRLLKNWQSKSELHRTQRQVPCSKRRRGDWFCVLKELSWGYCQIKLDIVHTE